MNIFLQLLAAVAFIALVVWIYYPWLVADLAVGPTEDDHRSAFVPGERFLIYEHALPGGFIFRYSDGVREYVSRARVSGAHYWVNDNEVFVLCENCGRREDGVGL